MKLLDFLMKIRALPWSVAAFRPAQALGAMIEKVRAKPSLSPMPQREDTTPAEPEMTGPGRTDNKEFSAMAPVETEQLWQALWQAQQLRAEIDAMRRSTSWRITKPLRAFGTRYPNLVRRLRRTVKWRLDEQTGRSPASPTGIVTPCAEEPLIAKSPAEDPLVTVIVPTYNGISFTTACLGSIARHKPKSTFEVIVIDDCSTDSTAELLRYRDDIRYIRNSENIGFLRSCNRAATMASGKYVFLLNNDTLVKPGWLDALVETFEIMPNAGLVGSKLIFPDGTLQEAGAIIWRDGSVCNFGRNQDTNDPIYNYVREVDYISGAAIMVPKRIWEELGGFDELFCPSYCEDCDLALRIRQRGYSVLYQPRSLVVHWEGAAYGREPSLGGNTHQASNTHKLVERWEDHLNAFHEEPGENMDSAKDRGVRQRALVLLYCTPNDDQASDLTGMHNSMLLLKSAGFQVTVIVEDLTHIPASAPELQGVGIEVLYPPYCSNKHEHLFAYGSRYDLVLTLGRHVSDYDTQDIRTCCSKAKIMHQTIDVDCLPVRGIGRRANDRQ